MIFYIGNDDDDAYTSKFAWIVETDKYATERCSAAHISYNAHLFATGVFFAIERMGYTTVGTILFEILSRAAAIETTAAALTQQPSATTAKSAGAGAGAGSETPREAALEPPQRKTRRREAAAADTRLITKAATSTSATVTARTVAAGAATAVSKTAVATRAAAATAATVATPVAPEGSALGASASSPRRDASKLASAKAAYAATAAAPSAPPAGGKAKVRGARMDAAAVPAAVPITAPVLAEDAPKLRDRKQILALTVDDSRGRKVDATVSCDRCYASSALHKAATDKLLRLQTRQSRLIADMIVNHHKATVCCICDVYVLIRSCFCNHPSSLFLHR